jgi:AcrR family transcriptional regulator
MQTLKKEIKERIMNAARAEFTENRFARAKMRSIAERAGVSTGNLYTYFPNKDDLFCTLVKPAVDQVNEYANYDRMRSAENSDVCCTYEWNQDLYRDIADVHCRNREEIVQCAVDLATYMYYGWMAIEELRIKDFGRKTNNVHL